jgi:hypothetical protein
MSAYKEGSKAFTITAANVATLDTTALTLYTFDQPSDRILVPKLLKLRYDAGDTAFSVAYTTYWQSMSSRAGKDTVGVPAQRYEEIEGPDDPFDEDLLVFSFTKKYWTSDATAKIEAPLFKVPFGELGLLGTTDTGLVAVPLNNGAVYTNDKYSFVVKGNGRAYSGGGHTTTGVIEGVLYFDEYFVGM